MAPDNFKFALFPHNDVPDIYRQMQYNSFQINVTQQTREFAFANRYPMLNSLTSPIVIYF